MKYKTTFYVSYNTPENLNEEDFEELEFVESGEVVNSGTYEETEFKKEEK